LKLATYTAIIANSGDCFIRKGLPFSFLIKKGSHRAYIHAGAAKDASGIFQRFSEGCADQGLAAPEGKSDCGSSAYILTGPHTASAKDTKVVVTVKKWVIPFNLYAFILVRNTYIAHRFPTDLIREFYFLYANVIADLLELAAIVFGANHASWCNFIMTETYIAGAAAYFSPAGKAGVGMLAEDKMEDISSILLNLSRVGLNFHPFCSRSRAGSW